MDVFIVFEIKPGSDHPSCGVLQKKAQRDKNWHNYDGQNALGR